MERAKLIELRDLSQKNERQLPTSDGPLITIITANYNYENYIDKTIESVIGQIYNNIEHIVIDDGSTDNSIGVINKYSNVKLVRKENGGQVSAVIEGFKNASGEIIMFLDSDDILYPDACARVAAAYDPEVSLYQFGLNIVNSSGEVIGHYPDMPFLKSNHAHWVIKHGAFPSSPTSGNAFSASHVRRMIAHIGKDTHFFIDGYLIYSAPFFGKIKEIPGFLGEYLLFTFFGSRQCTCA